MNARGKTLGNFLEDLGFGSGRRFNEFEMRGGGSLRGGGSGMFGAIQLMHQNVILFVLHKAKTFLRQMSDD